jgi:hypothetical protein
MSGYQTWSNIVLRNITINDPEGSPGVIMTNSSNPIKGLVFDNVVVKNPGSEPFGDDYYYCDGNMDGASASGATWPVPNCFSSAN